MQGRGCSGGRLTHLARCWHSLPCGVRSISGWQEKARCLGQVHTAKGIAAQRHVLGRSGVYARPSKKAKVAEEGKAQLFEPVRSGMACCLRQEKMLKQALCQRSRGKLSILSRRLPEQCCALLAFSSFLACSKAELSKKSVAALGCFLSTNAHRAESRPQVTESRAKAACFTRTGFRSQALSRFSALLTCWCCHTVQVRTEGGASGTRRRSQGSGCSAWSFSLRCTLSQRVLLGPFGSQACVPNL